MDLDLVSLRPLEPGQRAVLRTRAAISAAALLAIGVGLDAALFAALGLVGISVAALALGLWLVFVSAPRRWSHWGYAFSGHELHVAHGWWTQVHTVVPVARVQHIDTSRSVLERRFGVTTLVLHTAGTEHARVVLPGLSPDEAERIRDTIRGAIGDVRG